MLFSVFYLIDVNNDSICLWLGAGPDGVEEIKRHRFFASIDWNVGPIYDR